VDDRERLEAIVKVVRQYLPPDGISIKEAMGKIIELVDPLPPKKEWVGLTDEERADWHSMGLVGVEIVAAHLKEKNYG
jgi:hypothetical protein